MLSSEDIDILLKYIYRGFSEPTDSSCSFLLTWHEKVTIFFLITTLPQILLKLIKVA